jgi:hypothetical protein
MVRVRLGKGHGFFPCDKVSHVPKMVLCRKMARVWNDPDLARFMGIGFGSDILNR